MSHKVWTIICLVSCIIFTVLQILRTRGTYIFSLYFFCILLFLISSINFNSFSLLLLSMYFPEVRKPIHYFFFFILAKLKIAFCICICLYIVITSGAESSSTCYSSLGVNISALCYFSRCSYVLKQKIRRRCFF